MKDIEVIKRGKMTYVLYPDKVVVGINDHQWTSYNQYDNWNRQGISQFRREIEKSKATELDNPADQMSLAYQCGIKGSGTQRPKDIEL